MIAESHTTLPQSTKSLLHLMASQAITKPAAKFSLKRDTKKKDDPWIQACFCRSHIIHHPGQPHLANPSQVDNLSWTANQNMKACLGMIAESHNRLPQSTSLLLRLMASQADLQEKRPSLVRVHIKVSSAWNGKSWHSSCISLCSTDLGCLHCQLPASLQADG